MSHKLLATSAIVLFAVAGAFVCSGQVEQGTITGIVTDQSGALVAGAKVTVTNLDTQVTGSSETNNQGNYTFPFLPHGSYSVTAEKTGFSVARGTGIALRGGPTATIDLGRG